MTDRYTNASNVWKIIVMTHSYVSVRVVLDGYYCHTWKFITLSRGKNGNLQALGRFPVIIFK